MNLLLINIFAFMYAVLDGIHDGLFTIEKNTYDSEKRKKVNRTWHILDAFIKLLVATIIGVLYIYPDTFGIHSKIIDIGCIIILILCYRFLLFNIAYNITVGKPLSYHSNNGIDRLYNTIPKQFIDFGILFLTIALNTYLQ